MMGASPHNGGLASPLPLNLIAQAIPRLTRHDLEALTERLIECLDEQDGDPDAEDDDPSGQCDEDEVNTAFARVSYTVGASGPGCPISDEDHTYY